MNTQVDEKTARRTARSKPGKTTLAHWREAVFTPVSVQNGKRIEGRTYMASFSFKGHRESLSMATDNKEAAAARALDIFSFLIGNGWEKWRAAYKPATVKEKAKIDVTVGEFIATVEPFFADDPSTARTCEQYVSCLRRVASDLAEVTERRKLGHYEWRKRVESVKLSDFTPEAIQTWKEDYLKGKTSLEKKHAKTSVNTLIRMCKALFTDRVPPGGKTSLLAKIREKIEIPEPVPFSKVSYENRQNSKYRSTFKVNVLADAARIELAGSELYKIFCLALFFGLRRNEADKLEWKSFRWEDADGPVLRVEETEDFKPKTEESSADLPIPEPLVPIFREYQSRATGRFVVESEIEPKRDSKHYHLRAVHAFAELNKWLRVHGVDGPKPLHTLRKEFGSMHYAQGDIYAASVALRHSNIQTTCSHYVKAKVKSLKGIGVLVTGARNIVEGVKFGSA